MADRLFQPGHGFDFGVVVGVDVEHARHDPAALGVDLARALLGQPRAHGLHFAAGDRNVGNNARRAGAIKYLATADHHIARGRGLGFNLSSHHTEPVAKRNVAWGRVGAPSLVV